MYFRCDRQPDGKISEWYAVDALPEEWPEGTKTNFYSHTDNKMFTVPGDEYRYFEMADGALCHNCNDVIDKSWMLYAHMQDGSGRCLCRSCWGDINHGKLNLPVLDENGRPLYRLRNSPIFGD